MKGDCLFCQKGIREIDFKDTLTLRKFISGMAKIRSRKRTYVCSKHQRKLATAIKRARYLGLLPYLRK
jgi:small subunit ribosomal protein S18